MVLDHIGVLAVYVVAALAGFWMLELDAGCSIAEIPFLSGDA